MQNMRDMRKMRKILQFKWLGAFILIPIIMVVVFLRPTSLSVEEDFTVYSIDQGVTEEDTKHLKIIMTGSYSVFAMEMNRSFTMAVDGRVYRSFSEASSGQNVSALALGSPYADFGIVLPNHNFTKFVVLFDESHQAQQNGYTHFITYPQVNRTAAYKLLQECQSSE